MRQTFAATGLFGCAAEVDKDAGAGGAAAGKGRRGPAGSTVQGSTL